MMASSSGEKDVEKGGNNEENNGAAVGRIKRETFVTKIKAILVEKPPSKNPTEFILAILTLCCCLPVTVCCCLGVLLFLCLPIVEVVIGALYFDDRYCPQGNIAPLLVVGGCLHIVTGLLERCCVGQSQEDRKESSGGGVTVTVEEGERKKLPPAKALANQLRLFSFYWLILSAVIVYRMYGDVSYVEGDPNFCEPLMYRFLFWIVTISLAILILGIALCCVFVVTTIVFPIIFYKGLDEEREP